MVRIWRCCRRSMRSYILTYSKPQTGKSLAVLGSQGLGSSFQRLELLFPSAFV